MSTNPLRELQKLGQSPWHDNIRRDLLTSGKLKQMVKAGDITGLTSNPTIFEQAIGQTNIYDEALAELALAGKSAAEIFDALSIEDIRAAADVFAPVYEKTKGADGYVSIEVAPAYARDTQATIKEAKRLWKAVGRPNLMVKIPATKEGLPAIEQSIADGINVNVTLIFSIKRYREVMDAYLAGLERRLKARKPIDHVASVASFFVSRVDTLVDKLLDERIRKLGGQGAEALQALKGKAAIANAQLAYAEFRRHFSTVRFSALAAKGARLQRPLWASTSTKNPAYPDVMYIEALIGPDTVNTMPPATLAAYKDHGKPELRLTEDVRDAQRVIEQLEEFGIRMDDVTQQLEDEGVAAFAKSFDTLLAVVEARRQAVLLNARQRMALGRAQKVVDAALAQLDADRFGARLWQKDPTLWKPDDPTHQAEIKIRLGWLDVAETMARRVTELTTFAGEVRRAGFTHALLCGMGGSSLAPEVMRTTFGVAKGYLDLAVLDSTDPAAVLAAAARSDPARTLFIIASKSGGTAEINAMFKFFWQRLTQLKGSRAGENFIAITDPGTSLETLARERGFRRVFLNPPEIGGRYSALSYFGLVPAALMGVDVARLLDRARAMMSACGGNIPATRNPALRLGAALGALAEAGRDKATFILSDKIAGFGYWIEQLIAESTGKEGKGILPVEGEAPGKPSAYGNDRVFIYLKLGKDVKHDKVVKALEKAGRPVIEIPLSDVYDLGGEFLRWEIATAAAGRVLGINPFDQPDVQEAKDITKRYLAELAQSGRLPEAGMALSTSAEDFDVRLRKYFSLVRRNDYIALMAYFARTPRREKLLRELQALLRDRTGAATTIGYGPRFLHSTGQLHKGGANNGVFLQLLVDDPVDAPIEGEPYTFSGLKQAQALGDYSALLARRRRVVRIRLGSQPEQALQKIRDVLKTPTKRK
ncbi:MAG: bifunctional transaldolase/phosoglucose isomerase, partial [Anaerolineales bacterium]|nr:bifunctional transaldolase/phosoglucose isomerase [Anaerolineales bacterium]